MVRSGSRLPALLALLAPRSSVPASPIAVRVIILTVPGAMAEWLKAAVC